MPFRPGLALATTLLALVATAAAAAEQPLAQLLGRTHIHGLAVDGSAPDRLLIATHHGLFALDLEAGTVATVSERPDDFMGFRAHPSDPDTLFASGHPATGGNLGFIVSTDGGRSWTMRAPGVGGPVDFHQMAVSPADPEIVYGAYRGLQRSLDAGHEWTRIGPAPEGLIALAASATDPDRLYAATQGGLLSSTDAGRSWQSAHPLPHPVTMVEVAGDGTVYAFMLGQGLIASSETTLDWQPLASSFGDRYMLHLAVDPHTPTNLYASTQQGELLTSPDGGRTWRQLGP